MKPFFLFFIVLSKTVFASPQYAKYESQKLYYSALNSFFLETHSKTIDIEHIEKLESLLFFTGIEILEDYDEQLLKKYPSSSTYFIQGRKALFAKDFRTASKNLEKVHEDHRFHPESMLLLGQLLQLENKFLESDKAFQSCQWSAEKQEKKIEGEKIKRYYRMIYEICLTNQARRLFKESKYQEAINKYDQIPKNSYKWPYLLLEKAWAHFHLGDYNRVIGILITYKSPLLDTYFFPEAEYLAALSYFKLCLYDDALIIIDQYYKTYRPRFTLLESVLRKNIHSESFFYDILFRAPEELEKHTDFVRHILTRLKKQTRFSLDFNTVFKLNQEIERIKGSSEIKNKQGMIEHLLAVKENMIIKMNYNAKKDIFEFLETVPFYSSELFKLNLEIISRKKDLLYQNKQLVEDRSRGDFSNVKRSRFEYFWRFEGEFWGDELGDYSLGLKSNCEFIRINKDGE
jgi:hypothetical protein